MKIALSRVEEVLASDESTGFCLACGADQEGCEPDAREYRCESCGARQVYGAEEVLVMGAVFDDEGEEGEGSVEQ
jgi:hypothetical protein